MKFTLDDKSPEYIAQLNKIVDKHRDTNPLLIRIFCKYADTENGCISTREGIFAILSEPQIGIMIQASLPYMILNPAALAEAETDHLKGLDYKLVKRELVVDKLEKVKKILAVKADPWYTSIGEVRSIWIAHDNICYRSIDLKIPGYFFTPVTLRKGWEDIYVKRKSIGEETTEGSTEGGNGQEKGMGSTA